MFLLPSNNYILILYLIQLYIAECLFFVNLERKEKFVLRFVLSSAAFFVLGYFIPAVIYNYVKGFLTMSAFIISVFCFITCFEHKFADVLFCILGAVTVQNLTDNVRVITISVFGMEELGVGAIIITIFEYAAIYAAAYFICAEKIRGLKDIAINRIAVIVLVLMAMLTIFTLQFWLSKQDLALDPIARLPFLLCNLFMLFMQFGYWDTTRVNSEKQTLEQMLQQQAKQYELSKQTVEIINMKCHDIKNQISVLKSMGGLSGAGIAELENSVLIYDNIVKTGNKALDVVLCEKGLICEKEKIRFICIADGVTLDFIEPVDVAMLFGNALDNAIESVRAVEEQERLINLKITHKAQLISICIENTCGQTPVFKDGLPETVKHDKQNHGYGVKSMKYIVEKYGGYLVMNADNGIFGLNIVIPAKYESNEEINI